MVAVVNRLLRDGHALPQLVRHDGWGYHVHATEPGASVADRMGVEAAMAVADVVRAGALGRLGALRRRPLRRRPGRPHPERLPPVLRRQLRQPVARGGLPGAPDRPAEGAGYPVRSATSASRTSRSAGRGAGRTCTGPEGSSRAGSTTPGG